MLKRESLLLGLFLGVALTVTVVLLGRQEPEGPVRIPRPRTLPPPTAEEQAARADYLAAYARRKFAPWLARLRAEHPGDLAERVAAIVAEREQLLAGAREAARKGGIAMDVYCDHVAEQTRAKLVTAGGEEMGPAFDAYVATLPERLMAGSVNQLLDSRDAGMTVEQTELLCTVLHRHLVPPPAGRPTVSSWDAYLERTQAAQQTVQNALASRLTPVQLQAVREELELHWLRLRAQRRDVRLGQELATP